MQLIREDHIVFFGDSITEWGRDKADPTSLGHGYANFVAGHLAHHYPQYAFTFSNRGIGGDKSRQPQRTNTGVLEFKARHGHSDGWY